MNRWTLFALIAIHASTASGYQEPTHQAMSGEAAVASGILDSAFLLELKVNPDVVYPSDNNQLLTLFQLIQQGAYLPVTPPRYRTRGISGPPQPGMAPAAPASPSTRIGASSVQAHCAMSRLS